MMPATTRAPTGRWWHRSGIGWRLLAAQAVVLAAGVVTTAVVAAVVGPPLFREHLNQAGVSEGSLEEMHAEEAYRYATVFAIGGALAVSALAALAVSLYVSRRVQRSVTEVARAATAVSKGNYETRVSSPRLGDDFEVLAGAFNTMASRLESVESTRRRLFGDLAHEIRTPVAVLDAYIEALEDGVRTLTPQTSSMLRDQTRRLVRFSADLAALAHAEESSVALRFGVVAVDRLARRCVDTARDRYEAKGVTLDLRVQAGLPQLWADEQRLSQVLDNLLDNALRHTPSGGTVVVACGPDRRGVAITVTDDGDGIPAEHLDRVFERFYRADSARDRAHGGAGLGLAIAKALVELHGGNLSATSSGAGLGAVFTVLLPSAPQRTDHAPIAAPPATS